MTSLPWTVNEPAWATAAPMNPPSRVCEELDGIPNHHVRRFQDIAARSPANMTSRVIKSFVTEFAMVLPILNSPMTYLLIKNAPKLNTAAQSTAWNGVKTLVDTTVAIELAASWKPLM